jgi:UDP-3-O-[3-hydroxymyristoyl] N-acetylglucosamine deacetylase
MPDSPLVVLMVLVLSGALSLISRNGHSGLPCGHIVAYDSDHELNVAFVEKLLEATSQEDWVPIRSVAGGWAGV